MSENVKDAHKTNIEQTMLKHQKKRLRIYEIEENDNRVYVCITPFVWIQNCTQYMAHLSFASWKLFLIIKYMHLVESTYM